METKHFGQIECGEECVYHFASGLPGFDAERDFAFLTHPDSEPLLFMQSLLDPDLCFILLPVLAVDPRYHLNLSVEDLAELRFEENAAPIIGKDILCAVLISAGDGREAPTANLLAPIVVNLAQRVGMQVIQTQSAYSHRHPLFVEELAQCS